MKIGILQCDDVLDALRPAHGDFPDMLATLLLEQDPSVSLKVYPVNKGVFPERVNACDAYLTTGSRFGVNDGLDWIERLHDFVQQLHQARHKLVGICFGHQMMGRALGGRVEKSDKGWGVGMSFNQIVATKPWMQPFKASIDLVVSHQEQVTQLPEGAEVLATSQFCPYYMMQIGNHFLGIQGHPEYSKAYSHDLMLARRGTIIPDVRVREGLASLSAEVDDRLMMQWILRFFAD